MVLWDIGYTLVIDCFSKYSYHIKYAKEEMIYSWISKTFSRQISQVINEYFQNIQKNVQEKTESKLVV